MDLTFPRFTNEVSSELLRKQEKPVTPDSTCLKREA